MNNLSNDNQESTDEKVELSEEEILRKQVESAKNKKKGFLLKGSVGLALALVATTTGVAMSKEMTKSKTDTKPVVRVVDDHTIDENDNKGEANTVKGNKKKAVDAQKPVENDAGKKIQDENKKVDNENKKKETEKKSAEDEKKIESENSTKNKMANKPVVNNNIEKVSLNFNNFTSLPSNVRKATYGESGEGRPLYYYRIGNGKKTLLMNFAIHCYEDAWAKDGYELTKMAKGILTRLGENYDKLDLDDWSIYIIPSSNPDGLLDGYTNNGPGRCQVTKGIDLNRDFPTDFKQEDSSRNFNGGEALSAPESRALANLLYKLKNRGGDFVVLDVHGWLDQTLGDYDIGKYFDSQFGISNIPINNNFSGYLVSYAKTLGADVSLIELPKPSSSSDIVDRDFQEKLYDGLINLLQNY